MEAQERKQLFDNNWHFALGDYEAADRFDFDDAAWQKLNLPHDWSIEAGFDVQAPAGNDGGYQCYSQTELICEKIIQSIAETQIVARI